MVCADVPQNADLAKLIAGKWQSAINGPDVKGGGITEYKLDSTFKGSGFFTVQGKRTTFEVEGTWSVKGHILKWTVKKTTITEIFSVGETHTEEILEIDAKHLKYKGDDGEVVVETRIVDRIQRNKNETGQSK